MPDLSKSKFHTQGYTVNSLLPGDDATLIYTCPNNFSAITRYLHISNGNPATQKISLQFYHLDDAQYHYIAREFAVAGNAVANFVNGGYFNLHQGDKIVAYASVAGSFEVMVSLEEYYDPVRG